MFYRNEIFNEDLSTWDVSSVIGGSLNDGDGCEYFCVDAINWTLPKPNFINCNDNLGCD
jgi:surface protein